MSILKTARAIAKIAHRGQKYGDRDYFEAHVEDVVERVGSDPNALNFHIEVALLHDVLEDSSVTADDLIALGVDRMTVEAVEALTRRDGETYADFIQRASQNEVARLVKVHDLRANLANNPRASLRRRYESALAALGA